MPEHSESYKTAEALAGEGRVEVERKSAPEQPETILETPEGTLNLWKSDASKTTGRDHTLVWYLGNYRVEYSIDGRDENRTHTVFVREA